MTGDEAVKGIRQAARKRERAAEARKDATMDLVHYCQEAREAGVSITQIAREAQLSRQSVYALLGEQPSQ